MHIQIDPNRDYQLTYSQFNEKCIQFASSLIKLGVKETDVVVFFGDNSIDYAIALVGTIYLGLAFVPVPPAHGAFEVSQQLTQCTATVLLCGCQQVKTVQKMTNAKEYSHSVEQLKLIVTLDCSEETLKMIPHKVHLMEKVLQMSLNSTLPQIPYFSVKDPTKSHFLICFTSGTSGSPKACCHSQSSFLAAVMRPEETKLTNFRIAIWHPLGHISGTMNFCRSLLFGSAVVLLTTGELISLMTVIEKYRINVFTFSGNQARTLASGDWEQRFDLKSLKYIRTGGSKVPGSLLLAIKEKYNVPLWEVYGATEFFQAIRVRDPVDTWHHFCPGNVGVPGPNVELKIANLVTGESMPALEQGEICLRGPACFIGYLNNEEATRCAIDSQGFYHSGDVGFYTKDHCLYITDRIKELIKYKLYSLIPAEIEDFIAQHEAVEAVCIVGVAHSTEGSYIRAYVEVASQKTVTEQELIDYVAGKCSIVKCLLNYF